MSPIDQPTEGPGSQGIGAPPATARPGRLTLRTAMLLVLVAGLASAAWVKAMIFFPRNEPLVIDGPTIFVAAVALCGAAIAGFRKYSGHQFLAHVAVTYGLTACTVLLAEIHERLARYWLEIAFAATVAIPFAIQGFVLRRRVERKCDKRRLKLWIEAFVLANLNLLLAIIGVVLSLTVADAIVSAVKHWRELTVG